MQNTLCIFTPFFNFVKVLGTDILFFYSIIKKNFLKPDSDANEKSFLVATVSNFENIRVFN